MIKYKNIAVDFDAINDNHPEIIQLYGNNSPKICCDYFIDDKCY